MIELAWAAGFFDGEGSVYFTGKYITLAITQADRRPLDRFRAALDLGTVRGPYRLEKSPYFVYTAGVYEIQPVIEKLWPLLSEPKREQITNAKAKARGRFSPDIIELVTDIGS
jgi:hypothetical protein